jgi:hypothetical protein
MSSGERRKVRLAVWVHYDSETGYVWSQVYPTKKLAAFDEELNHPHKVMRLVSEPYESTLGYSSGSFGTEMRVLAKRPRKGERAKWKGKRK